MKATLKRTGWPAAPALAMAAALLVAAASAEGQTAASGDSTPSRPYSLSYDATLASRYLFQGLDYSEGNTVVQPNIGATFGKFSFGAWGNIQPDLQALNEVDLSLKYSHQVAGWTISPGYMLLRYPNRDWKPSQEMFVDLAWTAPINPTLSIHYDFDAGRGTYSTLGISRAVKAPVALGVNLFYQSHYYDMTGCPAIELKASAPFAAGFLTITPSLSRFATWSNGDFTGALAVRSAWLFAVNVAQQLR